MITRKDIAFMSALFAVGAQNYFDTGLRRADAPDNTKPHSLPKWKVGEYIIFAKNEKDAIKYAKKRGIWKPEHILERID